MTPLARLAAGMIRGYQLIVSPWVTQQCKYYPSCSAYALEAVRTHGAVRGTGLAGWRLLRCNPWSRGGVDHVPPVAGRHHDAVAALEPTADPHDRAAPAEPSSIELTTRPAGHLHPTQPART